MPYFLSPILSFFIGMILTRLCIPSIVKISREKYLFDEPNSRSAASRAVPTLGGVGIFIGFVLALVLNPYTKGESLIPFLIGGLMVLLFVGLKDDLLEISPKMKIGAQIFAALILILGADVCLTNLHGIFGIHELPMWFGIPLTVFVIIVFTNAFNLIDGIDGLASGLTMYICSVLGIWFFLAGHLTYSLISFSLVGALASFFYCNVFGKKNKLFMGDTGSLLIGLIMAVLIIQFNEFNINESGKYAITAAPAVSFGLVIYPLYDCVRVMVIRILQGRSPFTADKNHIHHRLLALGYSHRRSTCTIIIANAMFVIPLYYIQDYGLVGVMLYNVAIAFIFSCIPARKIHRDNLIKHDDPHQQILYPKRKDAQELAMKAVQTQKENKTALFRALEKMNIL